MSVKTLILSAAVSLLLASASAMAADPAPAKELTPQQQKMGTCNKQAAGKTGDERKAFMKSCLSSDAGKSAQATQQEKMKTCNATASAKEMKGDTRKAYMKTCLSGDAASAG